MKILVTGGAGFVASHLIDQLIEGGHTVETVDNFSTGNRKNLNPKAKCYEDDITNKRFWNIIDRDFDLVYHVAALARIQPSIKDPIPPHQTNINGTLNVLEFCRKHNIKLIFSSSSSIYAGDILPTRENALKDPKSPYSLQKWVCEQYIDLYSRLYGLDYAILRYFNVYGERQLTSGSYATVIGIFLDQKKQGKPLTITGDGEQRRDFTYVKDVVEANILAKDWLGTYNIGAGRNYSINDIAEMIDGKKEYIDAREGEVQQTLADNTKAQTAGWQPKMELSKWIEENI